MTQNQSSITFPNADEGYRCPCCNSFIKSYRRKLNCNMALCLVALVKHKINGFVKVEEFLLNHGYQRCGDFSYLVHWKFLEKMKVKREDGSNRNGFYKITSLGIMFVEGKITAKEKIIIRQNKFEGYDGGEVTIKQALETKFNYEQLMSNQ
jgi:hypothetical protein